MGSLREERVRYARTLQDSHRYVRALFTEPSRHIVVLTILALGLLAVGLDAYTTIRMMNTGLTEEANGLAATGMGWLGRDAYVTLATGVSAVPVMGVLLRPTGVARVLPLFALVFIGYKTYTVVNNFIVWASL